MSNQPIHERRQATKEHLFQIAIDLGIVVVVPPGRPPPVHAIYEVIRARISELERAAAYLHGRRANESSFDMMLHKANQERGA